MFSQCVCVCGGGWVSGDLSEGGTEARAWDPETLPRICS